MQNECYAITRLNFQTAIYALDRGSKLQVRHNLRREGGSLSFGRWEGKSLLLDQSNCATQQLEMLAHRSSLKRPSIWKQFALLW